MVEISSPLFTDCFGNYKICHHTEKNKRAGFSYHSNGKKIHQDIFANALPTNDEKFHKRRV